MKVGFLLNQIDLRGTGNAVYKYAHYNEEILGNRSKIYTYASGEHNGHALEKFTKRFGPLNFISDIHGIDILYHIKYGYNDGFRPACPYAVHSVFEYRPHGDKYATVSRWLAEKYGGYYVPHIVELPNVQSNLRKFYGIPEKAIVYGRHGGHDTFDIPWAWGAIQKALDARKDIWFLFLNTANPGIVDSRRIIFMPETPDDTLKREFINTCDAMLHARSRGETFGIAVGEFAICRKPVLTFAGSPERSHLMELGGWAQQYWDQESLEDLLIRSDLYDDIPRLYAHYTPEYVMDKFASTFLG